MSIHTPLPAVADPDNQRRHDLIEVILDTLTPYCDDPFACGGLYPKKIYRKFPSHFCGLVRDMNLHFPCDAISAMINGVLYVIEIPAIPPKNVPALDSVKFVANDLNSFQNWLCVTIKAKRGR